MTSVSARSIRSALKDVHGKTLLGNVIPELSADEGEDDEEEGGRLHARPRRRRGVLLSTAAASAAVRKASVSSGGVPMHEPGREKSARVVVIGKVGASGFARDVAALVHEVGRIKAAVG